MAELTASSTTWLAAQHHAVLITLRADGSPQSSNVAFAFDGETFRVSVTAGRAKTRNLARDPRAVVHVLGSDFWSYAAVSCAAELGAVTTESGDAAGHDLLALYQTLSNQEHPDPKEFLDEMVAQQRLVLGLRPESITGMGWDR